MNHWHLKSTPLIWEQVKKNGKTLSQLIDEEKHTRDYISLNRRTFYN